MLRLGPLLVMLGTGEACLVPRVRREQRGEFGLVVGERGSDRRTGIVHTIKKTDDPVRLL